MPHSPANESFGFDCTGTYGKKLKNKRGSFSLDYVIRLQQAQIECCDALRIIKSRDTAETFFYIDPPYVGYDQGHYDGHTQEDFDTLLLMSLKGKFLLSSYRNNSLAEYTRQNNWRTVEIKMPCPMPNKAKTPHGKLEVLTANHSIQKDI